MEELDLKELLQLFWMKKKYIIIITIAFLIIGIVYTMFFVKPEYESYTSLLLAKSETSETEGKTSTSNVGSVGITQTDLTLNQKLISTYSELIKTKSVLREALNNLQTDNASADMKSVTEDSLKSKISVTSVKDTELLKIIVKNSNPEVAKDIANELSQIFIKQVNEIYNINNVHVIDKAEVETTPANINHIKDIVIFAFIGLVISVMLVLVLNLFNSTIKTSDDVEKCVRLSVLAEIPRCVSERRGGRR